MSAPASTGSGFVDRAAGALRKTQLPVIIGHATDSRELRRREAFAGLDLGGLRAAAEAVRAHTLADLDRYLGQFASAAEGRGSRVFFAADGDEAVAYIRDVVRERGRPLVAKAKSMASEEIGLAHALEADGVEVVETDLGEYIVQLAGEPPSHITAPAVHKTRAEIAALFSSRFGEPLPADPEVLTRAARERLRTAFLSAGVGISGVNFGVAETGALCMVTNEGNGRLVTSLPPVHIALMGMERIVPTFEELGLMLPMLVTSASGRPLTAYTSFINGPRLPGEPDGPDEVHIVVLDNGRSDILRGEYRSILQCIRCGACQNVCPVYRQVGGHAYGAVYGGPIGAVLTPLLVGFERAGDLPQASSLCGACTEVCPVGIPLHEHLLSLRRDVAAFRGTPPERAAARAWSAMWRTPTRYRWFVRLSRLGQRPFIRRGRIRRAPFPLSGWTRGRDLPPVAARTFRERWASRRKPR
ncbi:MAG TPA: LutB/LldF family L-lactate oxidation iron-sulfur protein [Actinomycetota bacterium]|nr:LutB/LldF family L-lactate oxidation iron-sulfur protein [Actinomycetota bacterium]